MIESGTVTKIKRGGNVVVSFDRKSACDQCRMCAVSKGGKTVEVILKNTLGVGVGDKVEVTGSKYVLTAAVIVYVIPLILVAIAVFAFIPMGEIAQIIASVVALFLGLGLAVILDKFVVRKKKGFVPEMTKIITRAGEDDESDEEIEDECLETDETDNNINND